MIDSHLHLQDVVHEKRSALLACFQEQGFLMVFCNATSPLDWETVLLFSNQGPVIPFIGVHPWFVCDLPDDWYERFIAILKQHSCGVGEIGLDKGPKGKSFDKQITVFEKQIDAAVMYKRPFVVHIVSGIECVYSTEPVLKMIEDKDAPDVEAAVFVQGRQRQPMGSLPTLTGIFGLTIAHHAIQKLII